jgi:FkbM family methyltransferase
LNIFFRKPGFYSFHGFGLTFPIYLNPKNGLVDEEIRWKGSFEKQILQHIYNTLKPGDTYVDIGMNIGQHALVAAQAIGTTGHVYGYEPIPFIAEQAKKSADKNNLKNFYVHTYGLGKQEAVVPLYLEEGNIGASSVTSNLEDTHKILRIHIKNADAELRKLGNISLIKIDTEGQEPEILHTLAGLLSEKRPKVIFEYTPQKYDTRGVNLVSFMHELGYSLLEIESGETITDPVTWTKNYKKIQSNIFCF